MDKEYYIKQIEAIGEHIKNHASDYLEDANLTKLKSISFYSLVDYGSYPTIQVSKEYLPDEVI